MKDLPALPLDEWEPTKNTLHLYLQIVGKIKVKLSHHINHWWHISYHLTARGLTTTPIPYDRGTFEIEFDFVDHHVVIATGHGEKRIIPLVARPVAEFYREIMDALGGLGIEVRILARPYGVPMTEPFAVDLTHGSYDREYVERFFRIISTSEQVFREFRGRFNGKCSPVHLFWHSFDLAVTRFSGRPAPIAEGADPVTREAYSHEVISAGFWAGDANVRGAAYYAYASPEPAGLRQEPLLPSAAHWVESNGSSMALLMYDDLRASSTPREDLLAFLETSYQAAARRADWDADLRGSS
jgi:hypothetical protein